MKDSRAHAGCERQNKTLPSATGSKAQQQRITSHTWFDAEAVNETEAERDLAALRNELDEDASTEDDVATCVAVDAPLALRVARKENDGVELAVDNGLDVGRDVGVGQADGEAEAEAVEAPLALGMLLGDGDCVCVSSCDAVAVALRVGDCVSDAVSEGDRVCSPLAVPERLGVAVPLALCVREGVIVSEGDCVRLGDTELLRVAVAVGLRVAVSDCVELGVSLGVPEVVGEPLALGDDVELALCERDGLCDVLRVCGCDADWVSEAV